MRKNCGVCGKRFVHAGWAAREFKGGDKTYKTYGCPEGHGHLYFYDSQVAEYFGKEEAGA